MNQNSSTLRNNLNYKLSKAGVTSPNNKNQHGIMTTDLTTKWLKLVHKDLKTDYKEGIFKLHDKRKIIYLMDKWLNNLHLM